MGKHDCKLKADVENCGECSIREISLLCSDPQVQTQIEKAKTTCQFRAGQTIFYAGNDPLGLFTIQSGLVKLEVNSASGTSHTLRMVGAGGTLGYRSLFSNEPYYCTAVAVENSVLCFVPKITLLHVLDAYPAIAMRLLGLISKDLRLAEQKWMSQMDKGASERIAEAIVFLHEQFKHEGWTRREIAEWAGTTPETVIRSLAQFEKDGFISQKEGRSIRILKLEKLKEFASLGDALSTASKRIS